MMSRILVSAFLAVLFLNVATQMSVAGGHCGPLGGCPTKAVKCCVADAECCPLPCYKAVAKKGCLGKCRTVYVRCECECTEADCTDDCAGEVKVLRIGCKRVKVRICTCCDSIPCPDATN